MKYHPDKNKDPKSESTFRSIAEAYDVLSDPTKRRQYDAQRVNPFSFSSSSFHRPNTDQFSFDFDVDLNRMFQQFHDSISTYSRAFHQTFDHYQQKHFDFDHLFDGFGGWSTFQSDSFNRKSQRKQQKERNCRMILKTHGTTYKMVKECS